MNQSPQNPELIEKFHQLLSSVDDSNLAIALEMAKGNDELNDYLKGYLILCQYFFDKDINEVSLGYLKELHQSDLNFPKPENDRSPMLPSEIVLLKNHAESLTLDLNFIQALPKEIGQLTKLNTLKITKSYLGMKQK